MKTTANLTSQGPVDQVSVKGKVTNNPLQPKAADGEDGFLQMAVDEDEKLLQKKQNPLQLISADDNPLKPITNPGNPMQLMASTTPSTNPFQFIAGPPIQKKANKTGLPDQLKSGVENLSGDALDDVKVHYNSDKPSQLQAHAYAQGMDIHVAPGQEKHLPHEAWHVVQQKQGRVQPTVQMKEGVAVNDDKGLEQEADIMGAKAIQMKSVDMVAPLPLYVKNNHNGNSSPIQMYRSSKLLAPKRSSGLYVANTPDGNSTYHITPGGIAADHEPYNKTGDPHRNFEYCAHVTWIKWNNIALTSGTNQPHMYYRETAPDSWQLLSNTDTTAQNIHFKEDYGEPAYGAVVAKSRAKIDALKAFDVAPFVPDKEVAGFQKHLENTEDSVDLEEQLTEYREAVAEKEEVKRQAASSIEELKKNLSTFNARMVNWAIGQFKPDVTAIEKFLDTYGEDRRKVEGREKLLKTIDAFTSLAFMDEKKPKGPALETLKSKIAAGIVTVNTLVTELKEEEAEEAPAEEAIEAPADAEKWIKKLIKKLGGKKSDYVFDSADEENIYYYDADMDRETEDPLEFAIDDLEPD